MHFMHVLALILLVASVVSVCEARIGCCAFREMIEDPLAIGWLCALAAALLLLGLG